MLDEDAPNPVTSDDDLPRPPRGRRAATRPAGPPAIAPAPAAHELTPAPAVAEIAPAPAEVPVAPASEAPETAAPAVEQPAAEEPAETPAAEAPARARGRRSRTKASDAAEQAPADVAAAAEDASPAAETPAEPTAVEDGPAEQAPAPRSTRGRLGTRARSKQTEDAEPGEGDKQIEEALEAVEASVAGRRRASRAADPEIDKEQALASLAAVIAGGGEPDAETEDEEESAEVDGEAVEEEDQDATDETEVTEEVAAEDESDDGDEESADGEEQTESSSASRRRRRRGGRRRRRSSQSASESSDDSDDSDDDSDSDSEDSDGDDNGDHDSSEGDDSGNGDETTGTSSSTRRRRRRRRRGGDDSGDGDDGSDVAVRVREPRRSASDEISGIEGSTRLEAKKQRRREGRAAGRHRAPILTEAEFLARRESVERVMLVRQRDDYTQLAVLEDGVLVEHYVDRSSSTSLIGNIYLGRVQNVLPSMEAVFIDIGRGRNAVLYAGEVDWDAFDVSSDSRKVEQVFKSGQAVLVQVSKDPVGAKGARLTGHVSIPGRYVVYSPGGHLSGISRKLPDAERQRLKQILDTVVSDESSVIVRTAAEGASTEELVHDVERLKAQWEVIEKKAKQGGAPQQLYAEPDLTLRIIRDTFTEDFRQLIVAGNGGPDDAYQAVSGYLNHVAPHLVERLTQWTDEQGDPFAKFRIDEQISKALERKVFLPSGGSLVIDRTEAMTVIDVNTGKFTGSGGNLEETVTRNNLEAAEEIVRQLRLRDLGGIIVIDFIDMVLPSNRELLLRRLIECLGRDRTRHQVSEVTSLGLVQMTRKRIGTGLAEAFTDVCEHCGGRGYVRHDEPVESQAPADGGERHGRQSSGGGQSRSRARNTNRSNNRKADDNGNGSAAPKANQVQPSEAAREAAAKLVAASRHHAVATEAPAAENGAEPAAEQPSEQ